VSWLAGDGGDAARTRQRRALGSRLKRALLTAQAGSPQDHRQ
jgi:hypothetical protein